MTFFNNYYFFGLLLLVILLSSYCFTRIFIKMMINYKYGIDLHKKNKNKIPEMGGIIPVVIASLILMPFNYILSLVLLLVGSIGVYDDLFKLSPFKKLVLLGLVGGIVGYMLFGFDPFKIVIMAIGVSISSNFTNMLAGFNGLEIGLGIISTFFLGLILLLNGEYTGFKLVMLFITSYIGFFLLNKFPAKVFPGDVGTLPIGAFLATIAIKYNLILEYIIIMTPYIIDALLKYISAGVTKREDHKPTTLREDGKLYVSGGYLSLPRIILKKYPMKEYEIVIFIWGIGVFFGIVALLFGIIIKNKFFNLF